MSPTADKMLCGVLLGYQCVICFLSLKEVDWEVELAFVIGRRGKHIRVGLVATFDLQVVLL